MLNINEQKQYIHTYSTIHPKNKQTDNVFFFPCIFLQRDPILAKQLFSSLFAGILQEMETHKSRGESGRIKEELRCNMNTFLSKSTLCFPPFIACVQVMAFRNYFKILSQSWICKITECIHNNTVSVSSKKSEVLLYLNRFYHLYINILISSRAQSFLWVTALSPFIFFHVGHYQ